MSFPYTAPLTILICGGGGIGANNPIDNCVTIQPEVPNANWTIERMVGRPVILIIRFLLRRRPTYSRRAA